VPLLYADASALVRLVRDEPESDALRAFLADADLVSSELVLTEVPRAIGRAAADDARLALGVLLDRADSRLGRAGRAVGCPSSGETFSPVGASAG
jgi:predicted nucleic acid-binding protein